MDRPHPEAWARYAGFEPIPVRIAVRVGTTRCTLGRLASLEAGEILVLDRPVGSPFDLLAGAEVLAEVEPVAADGGVAVKLVRAVGSGDEHGS